MANLVSRHSQAFDGTFTNFTFLGECLDYGGFIFRGKADGTYGSPEKLRDKDGNIINVGGAVRVPGLDVSGGNENLALIQLRLLGRADIAIEHHTAVATADNQVLQLEVISL